jgi:pimeloyl-ACP methyl ester carboxylesterase
MGGYDQSLILAQTIGNSDYRYIAISRPGYLGTPMDSGKTAEQQGDLIAALLDTLGIEKTGVIIEITRNVTYPLEDLSVPVLVVHGTEDRLLPFEAHAKIFEARVPNAELFAVEGGDHVAIITHRKMVRAKVIEFMKNHFE